MPKPMPFSTAVNVQPARRNQIDAAWTLEALQTVWERQRDRVGERIDTIERTIAVLSENRLDDELRHEAERAAHMLAGSVGMFGFIDASRLARELERELAYALPDRAAALAALAQDLRDGLQGEVTLCAQR